MVYNKLCKSLGLLRYNYCLKKHQAWHLIVWSFVVHHTENQVVIHPSKTVLIGRPMNGLLTILSVFPAFLNTRLSQVNPASMNFSHDIFSFADVSFKCLSGMEHHSRRGSCCYLPELKELQLFVTNGVISHPKSCLEILYKFSCWAGN